MSFFAQSPLLAALIAWVLTYLLHSTVLFLAAKLASIFVRRPDREEMLWRAALLAGVLTASLQPMVAGNVWTIAAWEAAPIASASDPAQPALDETRASIVSTSATAASESAPAPEAGTAMAAPTVESASGETSYSFAGPFGGSEGMVLGLLAGLAACYFWLRPFIAWRRFQRRLAGRLKLEFGVARDVLDELIEQEGYRHPVALSCSPAISGPFAFGFRRLEICVPERALRDLTPAELRSLLAHELAHVVRRDPWWRFFTAWLEDLLFFQPLNRLTGRRLAVLAEFLSDDWARRHTDSRSMASCLLRVAEWLPRSMPRLVAASPMGRSNLSKRVHRLVAGRSSAGASQARPALLLSLGAVSLAVLLSIPGVVIDAGPVQLADEDSVIVVLSTERFEPAASAVIFANGPEVAPTSLPASVLDAPAAVPFVFAGPRPRAASVIAVAPAEPRPAERAEVVERAAFHFEAAPKPDPATPMSRSSDPVPLPKVEPRPAAEAAAPRPLEPAAVDPEPAVEPSGEESETEEPRAEEPREDLSDNKPGSRPAASSVKKSCDLEPRLLRMESPAYPPRARMMFLDEVVVDMTLSIDASGKVIESQIDDPMPVLGFGRASEKVLRTAVFERCRVDGRAVPFEHQMSVRFRRSEYDRAVDEIAVRMMSEGSMPKYVDERP